MSLSGPTRGRWTVTTRPVKWTATIDLKCAHCGREKVYDFPDVTEATEPDVGGWVRFNLGGSPADPLNARGGDLVACCRVCAVHLFIDWLA